jgi:predicted DsbA family dithiol-disulfide isomerase
MQVEIWSDVVCPWCYIGKRRFESALDRFAHRNDVQVVWRSFELDPSAPALVDVDASERLATKYGVSRERAEQMHDHMAQLAARDGLSFHFDRARSGNTFDAHRLLHLARAHGVQPELKERLMRAYFSEGEAIGDPETLARLAAEVGLASADIQNVLNGDAYGEDVRADEREAAELGIRGVPFFVLDRRYGISGAQPADLLLQALEQAWAEAHPRRVLQPIGAPADDNICTDETCAL